MNFAEMEHVDGVKPIHKAILGWADRVDGDDYERATAAALLIGYYERWRDDDLTILEVEQEFVGPLVAPENGRCRPGWRMAGKLDAVAKWVDPFTGDELRVQVEHKTTSSDLGISSPYWDQLRHNLQVSHYALAQWIAGNKLDGTLFDVIRKPSTKPKAPSKGDSRKRRKDPLTGKMVDITPEERRQNNVGTAAEMAADGTYFGWTIEDPNLERESPEMYFARLVTLVLETPSAYFARRYIQRFDDALIEHAETIDQVSRAIDDAYRLGRHPRNRDACMNFGRACQYLSICDGYDEPGSQNWVQDKHPELETDGGSLKLLTASRVRCWNECRQKEYLRYGLGLRRAEEESSEALRFGSLFHAMLEQLFTVLKERMGESHGETDVCGSGPAAEGEDPSEAAGAWSGGSGEDQHDCPSGQLSLAFEPR